MPFFFLFFFLAFYEVCPIRCWWWLSPHAFVVLAVGGCDDEHGFHVAGFCCITLQFLVKEYYREEGLFSWFYLSAAVNSCRGVQNSLMTHVRVSFAVW